MTNRLDLHRCANCGGIREDVKDYYLEGDYDRVDPIWNCDICHQEYLDLLESEDYNWS